MKEESQAVRDNEPKPSAIHVPCAQPINIKPPIRGLYACCSQDKLTHIRGMVPQQTTPPSHWQTVARKKRHGNVSHAPRRERCQVQRAL